MYAPVGLLQIRHDSGSDSDLVDVAASRSPSLQQIFGPIASSIARLSPIGDEFSWYLERIAFVQTNLLAAKRATLTFVGRFAAATAAAATASARRAVIVRVVDGVLYAARATLHDGLPGQRHASS